MEDQASGGIVASDAPPDNGKGIKRAAEDAADDKVVKKQETESLHTQTDVHPDDKNTFRLNPPTLIHGVAKPAPRDQEDTSENKEKPLLRPSLFGASSNPFLKTFSSADSTSQESSDPPSKDGDANAEDSEKPKVNFLKLSTGESDRDVGFGVFGTFSDSHLHKVDFSSEQEKTRNENGGQNYFLQFSESSEKSKDDVKPDQDVKNSDSGVSSTEKDKFVFGQNMNARVTSPSKQEGELHHAGQYVFGQNLSDRVKKEEVSKTEAETAAERAKSLAENAKALESAREKNRVKFDEVEPFTGEEGEQNVIQAQCKLHLFQVDKQMWIERGRGLLRLNDRVPSDYTQQMESRIVMRAQGSLRVLLNAKIWSDMTAEKVSTRNIRISALDSDTGSVKIYLITATPNDAEQIFQGIDYRIQALKHSKDTKPEECTEKESSPKDGTEDSTSNSATLDSENNEAEYIANTEPKEPEKPPSATSTAEVTSSSNEPAD